MNVRHRHVCLESFEPEVLFGAVAATGFDHRLLDGGPFRGQLDRVVLPNCCLDRGLYSLPCFAQGAVPKGCILVGLTYGKRRAAWANGYELSEQHLLIFSEGNSIEYRSTPTGPWYALQIRRDVLQTNALALAGQELELPRHGCVNLRISPTCADQLRKVLNSIIQFGNELRTAEFSATAKALESQLLALVDVAVRRGDPPVAIGARQVENTQMLVHCVEDMLASRLAEPFRLSHLVEESQASERTIQRMVGSVYGLSPRRLFLVAQLNQIRKELLANDPASSTVEESARTWGVTNLGRFAARYRAMFGENPHETLIRRQDSNVPSRHRRPERFALTAED